MVGLVPVFSEIVWTSYEFVTVINGVHPKCVVKRLVYHKCLLFYMCPETELFCNATWQRFLECLGSEDSPSILFISSLALHSVAACVMHSSCGLSFFPPSQDACWMQAPLSIVCFWPLLFPGEISLSNLSFYIIFLIKQREDTAVAEAIITNFVSCNTETSGNYLGSYRHARLRHSTVYYSSCVHCLVLHKEPANPQSVCACCCQWACCVCQAEAVVSSRTEGVWWKGMQWGGGSTVPAGRAVPELCWSSGQGQRVSGQRWCCLIPFANGTWWRPWKDAQQK